MSGGEEPILSGRFWAGLAIGIVVHWLADFLKERGLKLGSWGSKQLGKRAAQWERNRQARLGRLIADPEERQVARFEATTCRLRAIFWFMAMTGSSVALGQVSSHAGGLDPSNPWIVGIGLVCLFLILAFTTDA